MESVFFESRTAPPAMQGLDDFWSDIWPFYEEGAAEGSVAAQHGETAQKLGARLEEHRALLEKVDREEEQLRKDLRGLRKAVAKDAKVIKKALLCVDSYHCIFVAEDSPLLSRLPKDWGLLAKITGARRVVSCSVVRSCKKYLALLDSRWEHWRPRIWARPVGSADAELQTPLSALLFVPEDNPAWCLLEIYDRVPDPPLPSALLHTKEAYRAECSKTIADYFNKAWEQDPADLEYGEDPTCDADDCWYSGNLDRRNEYTGSYHLRPWGHVYCEVCLSNACVNDSVYEDTNELEEAFLRFYGLEEEELANPWLVVVGPEEFQDTEFLEAKFRLWAEHHDADISVHRIVIPSGKFGALVAETLGGSDGRGGHSIISPQEERLVSKGEPEDIVRFCTHVLAFLTGEEDAALRAVRAAKKAGRPITAYRVPLGSPGESLPGSPGSGTPRG